MPVCQIQSHAQKKNNKQQQRTRQNLQRQKKRQNHRESTTSAYLPGPLTSRAPHLRGPFFWDPLFMTSRTNGKLHVGVCVVGPRYFISCKKDAVGVV